MDITDSLYDAIETTILTDITYIDSTIFSENTFGILIDNLFKYIDYILMYRRTETPDRVVLSLGTTPQNYTYTSPDNIPRGAI